MSARALPGMILLAAAVLYAALIIAAPLIMHAAPSQDDALAIGEGYYVVAAPGFALGLAGVSGLIGIGWILAARRTAFRPALAWSGVAIHAVGAALLASPPLAFFLTPQRYPSPEAVAEAAATWANAFTIVGASLVLVGVILLGVALFRRA